jgi:hypothetical protein
MTTPSSALFSEADYSTIENALEATEKGRRFLRAYLERNRSSEIHRLLRSISRLHRATIGEPGLAAEMRRELDAVLDGLTRLRAKLPLCANETARTLLLLRGLEDIEAALLALNEAVEEREDGLSSAGRNTSSVDGLDSLYAPEQAEKLFGELSYFFSADARLGVRKNYD